MVGTIVPLVKAASRTWFAVTTAFMVTSVIGGALVGVVAGALGSALGLRIGEWLLPFAVTAVLLALIEIGALPVPIPTFGGSVPQSWWVRQPRVIAASAYGLVLGIGVTTFIPFASFYAVLAAYALAGVPSGALVGASYGLGRAAPVLAASLALIAGARYETLGEWARVRRPAFKRLLAFALIATAVAAGVGGS